MKRALFIGLLATSLAGGTIACGGDEENDNTGNNGSTNNATTNNATTNNATTNNATTNNATTNNATTNNATANAQTFEPFADECTRTTGPGDSPQETFENVLGAFIEPDDNGEVICLVDGTYELSGQIDVVGSNIKILGQSQQGTVLDFAAQSEEAAGGANGILAEGVDGFHAENFHIKNTAGDAIKVKSSDGVTFRNVTVSWDEEGSSDNGAYGLYPVQSQNILMEGCEVSDASDAGIYVGQSTNAIIRDNVAFNNVAGIEIENTTRAEVYDNHAYDNTGGLLIFDLPNLEKKNGERNLIRDNIIENNNHRNFASGGIVRLVPKGTGVLILASDKNELQNNTVENNISIGLAVIAYESTAQSFDDPDYDQYPEGNWIHDNTFIDNGGDPQGIATQLIDADPPYPAILWDGVFNPEKDHTNADLFNCFSNNVDGEGNEAGFGYLRNWEGDAPEAPTDCSTDISDRCHYTCEHTPLESVELPQEG